MKLPELLELAVKEQDWLKVCAVYTAITGKPLSPPKPKTLDLLNLEIPEELLEQFNDQDEEEDEYDEPPYIPDGDENDMPEDGEPEPEIEDSKKKDDEFDKFAISHGVQGQTQNSDGKTLMRKEPMNIPRKRTNKFKDNLNDDLGDLKKNNPILEKVYSKAGRRVSRKDLSETAADTSKKIDVQCSLCNRKQKVSPLLARGWKKEKEQNTYRCTECDTPSGRVRAERSKRDLGVYNG